VKLQFRFKFALVGAAAFVIAGAPSACKTASRQPVRTAAQEKPAPPKSPDEPTTALPPDLFKQMPIYPGAQVQHVRRPKGAMREILLDVDANFPQLVGYYKGALKQNDFRVTSSLIMPARKTWSCDFAKDGRPGSVMLYPSDSGKGKMTIDLIYEMPAKIDASMIEYQEKFDVIGPGPIAQQAPNPNEKTKRN
jgi:hypothetical protein